MSSVQRAVRYSFALLLSYYLREECVSRETQNAFKQCGSMSSCVSYSRREAL